MNQNFNKLKQELAAMRMKRTEDKENYARLMKEQLRTMTGLRRERKETVNQQQLINQRLETANEKNTINEMPRTTSNRK